MNEQIAETGLMFHSEEIFIQPAFVNPAPTRSAGQPATGRLAAALAGCRNAALALLPLASLLLSSCTDQTVTLPAPRFAQVGELRADVQIDLPHDGRAEATILWQSDGAWILVERIYHRGLLGGEVTRSSSRQSSARDLATAYASLIQQLNENPGLRLPGEGIPSLAGNCAPDQARIQFSMTDHFRGEALFWQRCAQGNLFTLSAGTAGPDPAASRIITAVQLIRSFTLGDLERSAFQASLPFATLGSGLAPATLPSAPVLFVGVNGAPPPGWDAFWSSLPSRENSPPDIRWDAEFVVYLTDGDRREAGHQLTVRRILPVGSQTLVEIVETVPGDFCTPAFVSQRPYQLVRVPMTQMPVQFGQIILQRRPCGI
jgi:hypothetical protein